jgi:cob(I)alamin adenosyltransferase
VPKWHPRVTAYGTVDELNAALGVAALEAKGEMLARIRRIQNDLFDLGADLATPDRGRVLEWTPLRIIETQVTRLEEEIDAMNAVIPPLDSFILPGGSPMAAQLHVARTLCRRAERETAHLASLKDEPVNPVALAFINRLSDWLFVAGRAANKDGADDVKWVPGANR